MFQRCFSQPVTEQSDDVLQRNENNDSVIHVVLLGFDCGFAALLNLQKWR